MSEKDEYTCWICKRVKKVTPGYGSPFCCGKVMKPTKICTKDPSSAEHARLADRDEPCDDGR